MERQLSSPLIVSAATDVDRLLRREGILHPFRKPQAVIRVARLPTNQAVAWERQLENVRQQCGCAHGAVTLGIYVLASVAYLLRHSTLTNHDSHPETALISGLLFAGGLIVNALSGKFAGLLVATVRYQRICTELKERLRAFENNDQTIRRFSEKP